MVFALLPPAVEHSLLAAVLLLLLVVTADAAAAASIMFSSEPIASSLCHLELRAALICDQSSFLHDFERLIDCSQSLNCALPSGVIWNAFRAERMVLVKSS